MLILSVHMRVNKLFSALKKKSIIGSISMAIRYNISDLSFDNLIDGRKVNLNFKCNP